MINYIRLNKYWIIITLLINLIWLLIAGRINYPPSFEQIGSSVPTGLLRVFCLLLVYVAVVTFSSKLNKYGKWFAILMLSSPFLFGLWYLHPVESVKLSVGLLLLVFMVERRNMGPIIVLFCLSLGIFNYYQSASKANVFHIFSNQRLVSEVNQRFQIEDDLTYKVSLPNFFRRIAYNKVSFLIRDLSKEFIGFWNLEDIFFQEMHPGSKKSLVFMMWPTTIFFFLGLTSLGMVADKKIFNLLLSTLSLGYVHYLTSNVNDNIRYLLALPFYCILISLGIVVLQKFKIAAILTVIFCVYGWQLFLQDLVVRPDYWLDNRPIVYQKIYKAILNADYKNSKIVVTDLMGHSKDYCNYYIGVGCETNFLFGEFPDRSINESFTDGVVYAGFIGEFLGPDFNNYFPDNAFSKIESLGFREIDSTEIRDSVAYKFGNKIFVGVKK